MFNDSEALLQNLDYKLIPDGWTNYNQGTPNNSVFFSNTPAHVPFFHKQIKILETE